MTNDKCPFCGASLHFSDEIGMFCPSCNQQRDAFQAAWEATRLDANEVAKQRQAADRALAATEAERLARALRGEAVPNQTTRPDAIMKAKATVSCALDIAERTRMPPPFAVCEGHAERLERLETRLSELLERLDGDDGLAPRLAALEGCHNELDAALGAFCDREASEDAELNAIADERAGQVAWEAMIDPHGYYMPVEAPAPTLAPVVTRVEVRDHFGRCLFFAAPANDVEIRYSDNGKTMTVVLRR
jgi:uncharacterized Zn finger protein (UPF0148 family)